MNTVKGFRKESSEDKAVNVNLDMKGFSEALSKSLKDVLDPLLQKEQVSADVIVDSVVAVTSTEVNKMSADLQNKLKEAVESLQKELNQKEVTKEQDEVLTIGDKTFRKSEMGAGAFAAIASMYESNLKMQKQMQRTQLISRVEKEFPNVPGTPEQKADFLEVLEGAVGKTKEYGMSLLNSLNGSNKRMTEELGTNTSTHKSADVGKLDTDTDASMKLEHMAEELAKKEGISKEDAYGRVLDTPEGERLYEEHVRSTR